MRGLDHLFHSGTISGLDESALVDRFANRRDPAAFEGIVKRHGAMVWSVCRQTLRDPNDAADAFQATFLIFAARAGSIRRRDKLGGWLHGVAVRVSLRARRDLSRRPTAMKDIPNSSQGNHAESREHVALLHEELARLPGKYRDPIVLCHLEGCTHDEAAARLGWPVGTVRGRLSRGRDQLRERLTRRGMAGAFIGFESISPPIVLSERTISTAMAGKTAAGLLSVQGATWLAWGVRTMMIKSWVLTGVVALGMVSASGAGVFAYAWQEGSKKSGEAKVEEKGEEPAVVKAGSKVKGIEIEINTGEVKPTIDSEAIDAAQEKAELEAKIRSLKSAIDIEVSQVIGAEAAIKRYQSGTFVPTEVVNSVRREVEPERRNAVTEKLIQDQTKNVTYHRKSAAKDRLELARMEARLAFLNNKVAEVDAHLNEEKADELVKAEAELDVMTIDVQAMSDQWQNARQAVANQEKSIEQIQDQEGNYGVNKFQPAMEKATAKLESQRQREIQSRKQYAEGRLKLSQLQRRVDLLKRHVERKVEIPKGTPDIESRLSRIEQALERLEQKGK